MVVQRRAPVSTIDVIDRILGKGIVIEVIEYEARVAMLGVDLCTNIEPRVVLASIDTFAPALGKTASGSLRC
jgi:hypothetical protein